MHSTSKAHAYLMLGGWLLLCFGAASGGALFPPDDWFFNLRKPVFQPPNWVFGPAWTLLYILMAVAAWRISSLPRSTARNLALGAFLLQLALNAVWTPVFFGAHRPELALLVIIALDLAVLHCWWRFRALDRWASHLLLPYLAWLSFATALNAAIWWLNR